MAIQDKIWDESQIDDNHSRTPERKNNSHLSDQCHSPTSISGNYLPQEAFTKRKKFLEICRVFTFENHLAK